MTFGDYQQLHSHDSEIQDINFMLGYYLKVCAHNSEAPGSLNSLNAV